MNEQELVKLAIDLVIKGNVDAWEQGYYNALFKQVLAPQKPFPILTYEYPQKKDVWFRFLNDTILQNGVIDFLEFGTFQGNSLRAWMQLNARPKSRFFGFDSFEGLPEEWKAQGKEKGHFDVGGTVPDIDDPRVSFIKGYFQDSLRPFLKTFAPQNRLVLHMDADLYSSTLYVLMNLDPFIIPDTLILFDEFIGVDEFPALYHYAKSCCREWEFVAAKHTFGQAAVRIIK